MNPPAMARSSRLRLLRVAVCCLIALIIQGVEALYAGQVETDARFNTIVDTVEDRCFTVTYFEWDHVPDATSYALSYRDRGNPRSVSGNHNTVTYRFGAYSRTGDHFKALTAYSSGDINKCNEAVPTQQARFTDARAIADVDDAGSVCGNGIVETGEECDDGNTADGDGCSTTCEAEFCGDGVIQTGLGEQCDDGNMVSGDGCSATCGIESPPSAVCGNGIVETGEQCDDGNTADGDGCSATCEAEFCGDGVIQTGLGEQCDDGNMASGDGCSATCGIESPPSVHDLAVTRIIAPQIVTLTAARPVQTRKVKVQIQNRSGHSETIPDQTVLRKLVSLSLTSLGACPAPTPVLVPPKTLPLTLKPKHKLYVAFEVTFDSSCANDPAKSTARDPGHDDYTYTARVDHEALGAFPMTIRPMMSAREVHWGRIPIRMGESRIRGVQRK